MISSVYAEEEAAEHRSGAEGEAVLGFARASAGGL